MKLLNKFLCVLSSFVLIFSFFIPAFAAECPRFNDYSGTLSYSEVSELNSMFDELSNQMNFDVVGVIYSDITEFGYNADNIMDCADDYFDYNGFGFGDTKDGAVLVLDINNRQMWISTSGYGIEALSDSAIEQIEDEFADYYHRNEIFNAFSVYASQTVSFLSMARSENSYYNGNEQYYGYQDDYSAVNTPFNWIKHIIISLVVGVIIGFIAANSMKSKLKSVISQRNASFYENPGSMSLTNSNEVFLYSNVAAVPIPKQTTSNVSRGGVSSTHVSSSGNVHGGGGRKL